MDDVTQRVDARLYARLPRLGQRTVVTLYRAIATLLQGEVPRPVSAAAQVCATQVRSLQGEADATRRLRAAEKATPKVSRRVVDNQADAVVAAISSRLEQHQAVAFLSPELAKEAQAMRARLFPEGTGFLRQGMHVQWEGMEALLRDLNANGDDARLRVLVGDVFVEALHAVHDAYGKAFGVTEAAAPASSGEGKVRAALDAAVGALEDLVLQIVAAANDTSAPTALRVAMRAALAPVDDLRARQAARAQGAAEVTDEDDEPDTDPVPDVT